MTVRPRRFALLCVALGAATGLSGCEPQLTIGKWTCGEVTASKTDPLAMPWSSGFEEQFCDYTELAGFCYGEAPASYKTVTSPVHSGKYAAAFSVVSSDAIGYQTRCVRQGVLPTAAYYGAWYFIPEPATNSKVWNLIHFQGGSTSAQHGLWDISLVSTPSGALQPVVFDFLNSMTRRPTAPARVPIGAWFHLQLYLKRAADPTGEVALYLDGQQLFAVKNIITDDSDWGQWYVGNFADGLMPSESTLYVDDVTIGSTL